MLLFALLLILLKLFLHQSSEQVTFNEVNLVVEEELILLVFLTSLFVFHAKGRLGLLLFIELKALLFREFRWAASWFIVPVLLIEFLEQALFSSTFFSCVILMVRKVIHLLCLFLLSKLLGEFVKGLLEFTDSLLLRC